MHHRHTFAAVAAASLAWVLFAGPGLAAEAGPELSVSLESGRPGIATAGWPLVIVVQLTAPDLGRPEAPAAPLRLASTGASWTAALQVTVTGEQGRAASWPWHLGTLAAPAVTLDARTGAVAGWWLSPEETAALAPGSYSLTVALDTGSVTAEGAWRGRAQGQPLELVVAAEPAPLPPALQEAKSLLLAGWHTLCGRTAEAMSALDVLLSQQPESANALAFKADLLATQGQREAALKLYDQALAVALAELPKGAEPPRDLRRRRQAVAAGRN